MTWWYFLVGECCDSRRVCGVVFCSAMRWRRKLQVRILFRTRKKSEYFSSLNIIRCSLVWIILMYGLLALHLVHFVLEKRFKNNVTNKILGSIYQRILLLFFRTVSVSQPESTTEEMNNRNNLRQMPGRLMRSIFSTKYMCISRFDQNYNLYVDIF